MVVPGRIVRQVTLGGLRVRQRRGARFMLVTVANRGNVTVQLRGRVTALLVRRGRQPARLSPQAQRVLLPRARAALALRYRGRVRGLVTVVVRVRLGSGIRVVERRYRIRL
jgi:predicted oxidoreductase